MKRLLHLFFLLFGSSIFAESVNNTFEYPDYVALDESFSIDRAIESALNNNYDLKIQQAALINASGQLQQAKASYDVKVGTEAGYNQNLMPTDKNNPAVHAGDKILYQTEKGEEFTVKAFIEKLFAFGINVKLNYQIQRSRREYKDGIYAKDPYYEIYGNPDYNNVGNFSLEVSVPLLKGFNSAIADKNLKLAEQNYESMSDSFEDSVARVIMQTAESYWNFFIAYERVQQLEKLVQKNQTRQKNGESLVSAGVRNRNDLLRIQVNTLEAQRQLESAKIDYGTAKVNLAMQIGIPVESIADPAIVIPDINFETDFPKIEDFNHERLERIAMNRPDMLSLQKACDAAALKVQIAKINGLPDLDLKFLLGTNGNHYGNEADAFLGSGFTNVRGLNFGGVLSFSMPIQNNSKKAKLSQAEAEYTEALAKLNKQKNTYILQLKNSISALNSYKSTVENAKNILALQQQVYDNEQKRYEAGISSIDNLIQQDQNWLDANMNYYQIFQTYLKYVLDYKYYTTNLIAIDTRAEVLYNISTIVK